MLLSKSIFKEKIEDPQLKDYKFKKGLEEWPLINRAWGGLLSLKDPGDLRIKKTVE